MPPKQNKTSTERLYGLSDAEMKTSISVLRLLAIDGNVAVDRVALARLTGHEKPNTAYKIWSLAKAKLVAANAGSVDNGTADDASPTASSVKPVKRARATTKTKAQAKASGSKKAVAPVHDDDDEEDEEEDSGDELNEPAPKRAKKLSKK